MGRDILVWVLHKTKCHVVQAYTGNKSIVSGSHGKRVMCFQVTSQKVSEFGATRQNKPAMLVLHSKQVRTQVCVCVWLYLSLTEITLDSDSH